MERVDGPDVLTVLGRRPWTLVSAGRMLGRIHAEINDVPAPPVLPDARIDLRERIEMASDLLPGPARARALGVLAGLPDGDRLCHGDFHPGNVIATREGPRVIDWNLAARGDPAGDVARTRMIVRLGEPPPGVSAVIRVGERFGRPLLVGGYLRAYRRSRPIDDATLDRWEVAHAAARLAERIESEYQTLIRLIESRALR